MILAISKPQLAARCLVIMLCSITSSAQAQLKEMTIEAVEGFGAGIPVFVDYPDKAAIIIQSDIPNLLFDSNMGGIVTERNEPQAGRYILIVEPYVQIIRVSAPGYIENRFRQSALQPREVVYYEIKTESKERPEIPVTFRVDPPDASITIDGVAYGAIANASEAIELQEGDHRILIQQDGYRSLEETIIVDTRKTFHEFTLERIDPVIVTVTTKPAGADVLLDGVEVGTTDSRGTLQTFRFPGSYQLTAALSGYVMELRQIDVTESGNNQFEFDLVRNAGDLRISVTPSDAVVLINKQQIALNESAEFAPGLYRIEVMREGYAPLTEDIEIERGQSLTRNYALEPYTGRLQYTVSPSFAETVLYDVSGAEVTRWVGSKLLSDLNVASYEARVTADGYKSLIEKIDIQRDQLAQVSVALDAGSVGLVDIDGNEYTTVVIGEQEWMAENLRTSKYRDGTPIPEVLDNDLWADLTSGAWSSYIHEEMLTQNHGKLYNWYAVNSQKNLCPIGWKIPTDNDWNFLGMNLGGRLYSGSRLKSYRNNLWLTQGQSEVDESGFNALPIGKRYSSGSFYDFGRNAYFWSSSESDPTGAWARSLSYSSSAFLRVDNFKKAGLSVRCLKDS